MCIGCADLMAVNFMHSLTRSKEDDLWQKCVTATIRLFWASPVIFATFALIQNLSEASFNHGSFVQLDIDTMPPVVEISRMSWFTLT